MNSLSIILNDGHVCAVESIDDRFEIIRVKGEKRIPLGQDRAGWYLTELLNNLGIDDLREWAVAVIYGTTETHILQPLLISLLAQNSIKLEVRSLEAILPELLLKRALIAPGQTTDVAINKQCWRVTIEENGKLTELYPIDTENPDLLLTEHEIPAAFRADFSFTTDRKELNRIEAQRVEMEKQWIECKNQLEIIQTNCSHATKNNLLNLLNYNAEKEKSIHLEKLIEKLCECIANIYYLHKHDNSSLFRSTKSEIDNAIHTLISQINNEFVLENFLIRLIKKFGILLSKEILTSFLKSKFCSAKILDILHNHEDWKIRNIISGHPKCPVEILNKLANDKTITVSNAAKNRIQQINIKK